MTQPTEAEAREAVDEARHGWFTSSEFDVRLDAYRAAVRRAVVEDAVRIIGLASQVPMRSATPENMAVLLFANKVMARVTALGAESEGRPLDTESLTD